MRNFLFAFVLLPGLLAAQQVQWLSVAPNDWVQNPSTPVDVLCARDPEHVYSGRLDAISYIYNSSMGANTLSRQGSDGATIWAMSLGDTVQLESIVSDAEGNVVLGGRYFQRLLVDDVAMLTVPPGHLSEGSFLIAVDENGELLWQQDVSGDALDAVSVSSLAVDPQGRVWAALSTFNGAEIVRLAADGSQVEDRTLADSKTIGSISFDPWGGLYVAGAATWGTFDVNGSSFTVPYDYAFFVARMNASGGEPWIRLAEDITFQKPRVQADGTGHAYLIGSYFEPLTWGSIPFPDPPWSTGFFLARLDSLGDFDLAVHPPDAPGSGQFILARGNSLAVDPSSNAYVLGTVGGALDWGSGFITGSGTITDNTVVLMKFDATGTPSWAAQGGSAHTDIMNDLAVTPEGICHLIGITSDPFTYGPYTVDPVNARGSVVARVGPDLNTGIVRDIGMDPVLLACPSLFTTSFRLVCSGVANGPSTTVIIFDAAGRTVEQANGLGEELGHALAVGAYTVVVRTGEHTLRTRVAKQ